MLRKFLCIFSVLFSVIIACAAQSALAEGDTDPAMGSPDAMMTQNTYLRGDNTALLINYFRDRNPKRLLDACGVDKPLTGSSEQKFLDILKTQKKASLRTLFLVVGGFTDGTSGIAYKITQHLPEADSRLCDVFYREHDEGAAVRELLSIYANAGKKIILIGHSWGGNCVVTDGASQINAPIELLVTIDPVGYRRPEAALKHVHEWLNIYVDYDKASVTNITNNVARIGSPWGSVSFAGKNISSEIKEHDSALEMYQKYAQDRVHAVLHKN